MTLEGANGPQGAWLGWWSSQGAWLAETGMVFSLGPRTEPFISGCKHELKRAWEWELFAGSVS